MRHVAVQLRCEPRLPSLRRRSREWIEFKEPTFRACIIPEPGVQHGSHLRIFGGREESGSKLLLLNLDHRLHHPVCPRFGVTPEGDSNLLEKRILS